MFRVPRISMYGLKHVRMDLALSHVVPILYLFRICFMQLSISNRINPSCLFSYLACSSFVYFEITMLLCLDHYFFEFLLLLNAAFFLLIVFVDIEYCSFRLFGCPVILSTFQYTNSIVLSINQL